MATEEEIYAAWEKNGYNPQIFPFYNFGGRLKFLKDGKASGAEGAQASISFSIDSFPIMLLGVRLNVTWPLPNDAYTVDDVALMTYIKRYIDYEFTIDIKLSSQSIIGKPIPINALQGDGGFVWHNFPSPYPMAGNNNFDVTLTRMTDYPLIKGEIEPVPTVHLTLISQQFRKSGQPPTVRRSMPG